MRTLQWTFSYTVPDDAADQFKTTEWAILAPQAIPAVDKAKIHTVLGSTFNSLKDQLDVVGYGRPVGIVLNHIALLGNVLSNPNGVAKLTIDPEKETAEDLVNLDWEDKLKSRITELEMDVKIQTGLARRRGEMLKDAAYALRRIFKEEGITHECLSGICGPELIAKLDAAIAAADRITPQSEPTKP